MNAWKFTPSSLLLTAAGLSVLAAATVFCSNCGSGAAGHEAGPSGPRPNILFVLTDDLSWDLVSHMANVRAMQKQGITFSHYFVTDSLCCPSRSSIFTGKYPHNTGVFTNFSPEGGYAAFERGKNELTTFATSLAREGYHEKMMGKYLNGYEPRTNEKDPGWTDWAVAGYGYPEYNYYLNQNGTSVYYGDAGSDYLTDVLHGMAVQYATPANTPFFLEVATFAPHSPFTPAPQDVGTYDAGLPPNPSFNVPNKNPPGWLAVHKPQDAAEIVQLNDDFDLRVEAVQAVDRMIGDLMAKLAVSGLDKNTYVIFSSDNGFHMGQHMLARGKLTAFDTDINVPLIVVGPGVPVGAVDDHLVENIDLCPTFAELGGAPALPTADGHSLAQLIQGQSVSDWRNVLLVEHKGGTMDPLDPDGESTVDAGPGEGPNPTSYEAIRMVSPLDDGGMHERVFVSYVDGEIEYYDISADPYEMDNTARDLGAATVKQFLGVVSAIKSCKGAAACWAAEHMQSISLATRP
jgi:N-acetylglucosamine-6-sulfatase